MKRKEKTISFMVSLGVVLILVCTSLGATKEWYQLADELCYLESNVGCYYYMKVEDKLVYFNALVNYGVFFPEETLSVVHNASLPSDKRAQVATDAIMQWLEITDEHDVTYFFVLEKIKGLFDYWPLEDKHALTEIRRKHLPLEKMPGYWLLPGEGDASYEEIREKSFGVLEQQFGLSPEEIRDLVFVAELYQRSEEETKQWEVYFHIKERSYSELYLRTIAYRQTWMADGTLLYAWQEEDAGEWWSPHDYDYLLPEPTNPTAPENAMPIHQAELPNGIVENLMAKYPSHLVEAWDVCSKEDGSKIYAIALWKEEGAVLMIYKEKEDGQFSIIVESQTALLEEKPLKIFGFTKDEAEGRLLFGYWNESIFFVTIYIAQCNEDESWEIIESSLSDQNGIMYSFFFDNQQGSVTCTLEYPFTDINSINAEKDKKTFYPLYRPEWKDAFDLRYFNIEEFFDIDFTFYALPK